MDSRRTPATLPAAAGPREERLPVTGRSATLARVLPAACIAAAVLAVAAGAGGLRGVRDLLGAAPPPVEAHPAAPEAPAIPPRR